MAEKKTIKRENWVSNFNLIGKPKVNDYSFKIDEQSARSSWIYNSMNLGVDCGEKHGTVYCELMGGYSPERANVLYKHTEKDGGGYEQLIVDWEDRFDDAVLEKIPDFDFIKVGLEKTDKGATYTNKFLSEYDAIAYIQEHLTEDMFVNVRGQLKYSLYQENVQVRKEIQSVFLSKIEDPSDFRATFTQSILLDKDSASLKDIDKDKGVMYVNARVLDYLKELNGVEIKGQFPFAKQFEFEMDFTKPDLCKKVIDKAFKVKKGITQMTWEGDLIEGGASVTATWEDVPDDIKELVDVVYTKEEAIERCSVSGNRERRMVLRKPFTKIVGEEGKEAAILQKFEQQYSEDDLVLDYLSSDADNDDDEPPFEEDKKTSGDDGDDDAMSWLNDLD